VLLPLHRYLVHAASGPTQASSRLGLVSCHYMQTVSALPRQPAAVSVVEYRVVSSIEKCQLSSVPSVSMCL
jgi:hypothetical protein